MTFFLLIAFRNSCFRFVCRC